MVRFPFPSLLASAAFCATLGLSSAAWATCPTTAAADAPADTIHVRLSDGAQLTLYVRNREELHKLRAYKMDSLLSMLDRYVAQAEAVSRTAGANATTEMEFSPAKESNDPSAPEKLRVVVYNGRDGRRHSTRTEIGGGELTKVKVGNNGVMVEEANGVTRVQIGGPRSGVSVHVEEGKGKDGKELASIRIGSDYKDESHNEDSLRTARRLRHDQQRTHSSLYLGLGLNTLTHAGQAGAGLPDPAATVPLNLRTWGSRFVQLGQIWDTRLGASIRSAPFVRYGFTFAFHNLMVDKNREWQDQNNVTVLAPTKEGRQLDKSKLAITSLNLPVLLGIKLRNQAGREVIRLAAGGFAGYRINAHTKLKYQEEGSTRKPKEHGSFNLEDFQYGLTGAVGVFGSELFVNYNLNEAFRNNRGPQGNLVSFGITLMGIDSDLRSSKGSNNGASL